jgi:hypothetical protein
VVEGRHCWQRAASSLDQEVVAMSFIVRPLPRASFEPLFALSDEELTARGIVVRISDGRPGVPCRVSLRDAGPGERVLLLNYEHQSAATPYRASHAIYVRVDAKQAQPAPGEIPPSLIGRLLSLRAFDARGMLVDADIAEGKAVSPTIERMLSNARVAELHAHYAKPGCYAALVLRA